MIVVTRFLTYFLVILLALHSSLINAPITNTLQPLMRNNFLSLTHTFLYFAEYEITKLHGKKLKKQSFAAKPFQALEDFVGIPH